MTRSHQITTDHVTVTVVTPPYGGSHHLVTPAVTLSSAPDDAGRPLHRVPADVRNGLLDLIGDAAGGTWPERARCSAVALVAEKSADRGSLGIRLLDDVRSAFTDAHADKLGTDRLLSYLTDLDESPWADLRGKPLDARALSVRLGKYGVRPRNVRLEDRIVKGYERSDLVDAWSRYLPSVADVADVAADSRDAGSPFVADVAVPPSTQFKEEDQQREGVAPLSADFSATSATPLHAGPARPEVAARESATTSPATPATPACVICCRPVRASQQALTLGFETICVDCDADSVAAS